MEDQNAALTPVLRHKMGAKPTAIRWNEVSSMTETNHNLSSLSLEYIEDLRREYLRDSSALSPEWQRYFANAGEQNGFTGNGKRHSARPRRSLFHRPNAPEIDARPDDQWSEAVRGQERIDQLIHAFRVRGHAIAQLGPLGSQRPKPSELRLESYGFREMDLDRRFSSRAFVGDKDTSLRSIYERLQNTYCQFIGVQFMHIDDPAIRDWLCQRMESTENRLQLSRDVQVRILTRLTDAVIFEQFVRKKYVGAKTFSLEGSESLIPLLDLTIEKAAQLGVVEIVMGMAHRGRVNVLANILGKRPLEIFQEFEDSQPELHRGRGDVKYHLGYSNDWKTTNTGKIHLSLCFNPSHLEYVNAVAIGRVRSKQDRMGDVARERGMALLIHGDAGFAGEGVVQETLNLSQLPAYEVGGTLHVIVNNQIGFTTLPQEGRSSTYASDVAKMLQSPIFHVNGENPEAVAQVVDLAMDFRRVFRRDVVIDMYCYRRWGHNEGDEPEFTQPQMYEAIRRQRSVRDGYLAHLLKLGELSQQEADAIAEKRHRLLENEFQLTQESTTSFAPRTLTGYWEGYRGGDEPTDARIDTGVDEGQLSALLENLATIPPHFDLHRKLQLGFERRREMARGKRPLDWSSAEALAFGSLALSGHPVRLSGQDTARGTFSQRHAVLHDARSGQTYFPLQHLSDGQAPVEIHNSPLSEAAVLGFEYGFSLDYPEALVAWEAQYGDFCNAAQVIIDQFLASAEEKWRRLSGLVLLLPHGFEGQGPEHSSARMERWLQLAAEQNIQLVFPTTPAQYFHCLRRQVLSPWRKPLVVLTHKSLLRNPRVASELKDCAAGHFQRILGDASVDVAKCRRVLLCTGKIYYELLQAREKLGAQNTAIVRLEQLYPLRSEELMEALDGYPAGATVCWVQEEPSNMGAEHYVKATFREDLLKRFAFQEVSRGASASPATGSSGSHKLEQHELITAAFQDKTP
jgi:2-oxoglutarate dehydrogenase E1 component